MFKKFSWAVSPLLMLVLFSPTPSFAGEKGGANSGGNFGSYSNTVFTVPLSGSRGGDFFRTILGEVPDTVIVETIINNEITRTRIFPNLREAYVNLVEDLLNAPSRETFTLQVGTTKILIERSVVDEGQTTNILTFSREGEEVGELSIGEVAELTDFAAIVAAISFAGGLDLNQVQTAIDMVIAGADPESVTFLMLALKEILDNDEADPAMLAFAIDTFNQIINDADLGTITELQNISGFMAIRNALAEAGQTLAQN